MMELNENNDIYYGDLKLLQERKTNWSNLYPNSKTYKVLTYGILLIGFAIIIAVARYVEGQGDSANQMPLHISIWITAIVTIFTKKTGDKKCNPPFVKFHSARFEAGDDAISYIYQQGMALKTYVIKDEDIEKIIRDDVAWVLWIKGKADITTQKREGITTDRVDEFYALVPFDEYDLDDLLAPYEEFVSAEPGTLRAKFDSERKDV